MIKEILLNVFKKLLFIIPLFFILACKNTNKKSDLRPDILSYEEYLKKEIRLPYILDIKKGNKHLVYFGARHSFDPADSMFQDIEKRLTELKPDIALNEGGNDWPVINNKDSTIIMTGDPGYLRYLCRLNNIPVMSIEPPDSLEYGYLLSKFNKMDIVLMYFCRQIGQLQNQELEDDHFIKYMSRFLLELKENGMPLNNNEIRPDFVINHYENFFKSQFNWHELDPASYLPIYSKTLLNEICRQSTYFRDHFIINQIEDALKKRNKIFVVMGGSHLVIQEPVLRYLLSNYD